MDFSEKLAALCAIELAHARRDPDRMGAMIERLCASLGLTISVAGNGTAQGIDGFMSGVEGYVHAEAVAQSKLAAFLAECRDAQGGR